MEVVLRRVRSGVVRRGPNMRLLLERRWRRWVRRGKEVVVREVWRPSVRRTRRDSEVV